MPKKVDFHQKDIKADEKRVQSEPKNFHLPEVELIIETPEETRKHKSNKDKLLGQPKVNDCRKKHGKKKSVRRRPSGIGEKMMDALVDLDTNAAQSQLDPYCYCIVASLILIPIFFAVLLWDTLAICVFEIPHYSMHNSPGFMMVGR